MTELAWGVAGLAVVLAVVAALLLWSVFFPSSWAARFVVNRPDHVPDWLPTNDPQRIAAAEAEHVALARWSA